MALNWDGLRPCSVSKAKLAKHQTCLHLTCIIEDYNRIVSILFKTPITGLSLTCYNLGFLIYSWTDILPRSLGGSLEVREMDLPPEGCWFESRFTGLNCCACEQGTYTLKPLDNILCKKGLCKYI